MGETQSKPRNRYDEKSVTTNSQYGDFRKKEPTYASHVEQPQYDEPPQRRVEHRQELQMNNNGDNENRQLFESQEIEQPRYLSRKNNPNSQCVPNFGLGSTYKDDFIRPENLDLSSYRKETESQPRTKREIEEVNNYYRDRGIPNPYQQ